MEEYVIGTCQAMCPEKEVRLREKEKLLHPFEYTKKNKKGLPIADRSKIVKEYSRAAAGRFVPNSADLRSRETLVKTVEYLLGNLVIAELKRGTQWIDIYEYVFDRLRAVRQDMVIQNIEGPMAISILEKTIRFLVYSGYHLCEEKTGQKFDPVINDTHLQECLTRLLILYKETEGVDYYCNRIEFECLYQIVNLGSPSAINRWYNLEPNIRNNTQLKITYCASVGYYLNNYSRVLKLFQQMTCIQLRWAMHRHLTNIYKKTIEVMSVAYSSKLCKYPVSKLREVLLTNSDCHTISLCRHYSISVSDNYVVFKKADFQEGSTKFLPKYSVFIDNVDENVLTGIFLKNSPMS